MECVLPKNRFVLLIALLSISFSADARSDSGCKVKYSWNTGNSMQGTFKNYTKTVFLEGGQLKMIEKK